MQAGKNTLLTYCFLRPFDKLRHAFYEKLFPVSKRTLHEFLFSSSGHIVGWNKTCILQIIMHLITYS